MLSYYKILEVDIDLIKIVGLCVFENSERLLWIEHIGVQRLNCGRRGVSTAHHSSLEVSPSSEFAPICPGFFAHLLLRLQAIILPSPWCDTCLAVGQIESCWSMRCFSPNGSNFSVLNTIHGYLKPSCKFHKRWTISKTSAAVSGQEHYRPELHSCDALRESPPLEANGILEALPGTSQIYSAGRTPKSQAPPAMCSVGAWGWGIFHVPAVSSCAVLISLEAMFWYSMIFHCHGNTWQQEETFLQKVW